MTKRWRQIRANTERNHRLLFIEIVRVELGHSDWAHCDANFVVNHEFRKLRPVYKDNPLDGLGEIDSLLVNVDVVIKTPLFAR